MTGRTQAFSLGESFAERYGFELMENKVYTVEYAGASLLMCLTADMDRVEETARWFAMGFWGVNVSSYTKFYGVSEGEDAGVRSLSPHKACPNFVEDTDKLMDQWKRKFLPPIRKRLNKFIKGYEFKDEDVYTLYEICAYEDAVTGAESPFCWLFNPEDFLAFEYLDDLWFHAFDGPGSRFSAALGAPWVQRMAERLHSNDSETLYFSFGHDVTILPVLSALGVFPKSAYDELGTDGINWWRGFKGGDWVPFCANLVVEKLQCENADYVRILSNQIPVPLEGCGNGPSGFTDCLCEVEAFLRHKSRRKAVETGRKWFKKECGLKDITWQ